MQKTELTISEGKAKVSKMSSQAIQGIERDDEEGI